VAKNLTLWVLSGELFPLDLLPESLRAKIIALPFSCAVYLPVGYITGRIEQPMMLNGFISLFIGIAVLAVLARLLWQSGIKTYTGTGA
jgi:ABC-2 type transport system permease protein